MSVPIADMITLPVVLAWIRSKWGKMIGGGVVCALLASPILFLSPKMYESTTTLLVSPPTFRDSRKQIVAPDGQPEGIAELMPRTLPMETYKTLALLPQLLAEVIEKIPLEGVGVESFAASLKAELVQMGSRTGSGVTYTQALIFRANASSPELAAKTAQTWADVFKEQVDEVAMKGVSETFVLLEALHKSTKAELEQAELALAEHKKAWNLDLVKAQLDAKQKQYTEFEGNLKQTEVDLATSEMTLKALEEELAKEPRKEVYFRAPSDDAYWITGLQDGGAPKVTPDQGLRTEIANSNHVNTRQLVVVEKGGLAGKKTTKDTVRAKLDEIKKEIETLTVLFSEKTVERDKLTRESDSLKASYKLVRLQYEKAQMADRTQASDIVIAGQAVVPEKSAGRSPKMLLLAIAFAGTLMTGVLLLLKELSEIGQGRPSTGLAKLLAAASGSITSEPSPREGAAMGSQDDSKKPV